MAVQNSTLSTSGCIEDLFQVRAILRAAEALAEELVGEEAGNELWRVIEAARKMVDDTASKLDAIAAGVPVR